jgi:hypothetical protein
VQSLDRAGISSVARLTNSVAISRETRRIALRILLTAGLILNGSGYAAASVHTHAGVDHWTTRAAAPCHVQQHTESPGQSLVDSGFAHATAQDGPSEHPAGDACQRDDCGYSCAQQSAAAVVAGVHGRDAVIARERGIWVMASGRASPTLPNPIRPPIG